MPMPPPPSPPWSWYGPSARPTHSSIKNRGRGPSPLGDWGNAAAAAAAPIPHSCILLARVSLWYTAEHMFRRTFKYRVYPTRAQAEALDRQLGEACRLYNGALDERRS